jgi:hypothetical protein
VAERGPEGAREIGLGEEGFASFFLFFIFSSRGDAGTRGRGAGRSGDDDNISPFLGVGYSAALVGWEPA